MEVMTTLERQIQRNHRLLEGDPSNVDLMLTYAQDCLRRDLRFEALVNFQKSLELKETPIARRALAEIFYLQSLYTESYDELRRLFKIEPVNVEGHILLYFLKDKEAPPADLASHLAFVPSRSDLSDAVIRAQNERDILSREVQEYEGLVAAENDPEPVLIYCAKEAQKRVERIKNSLDVLDSWDGLAIDMPGLLPPSDVEASAAIEDKAAVTDSIETAAEEVPAAEICPPAEENESTEQGEAAGTASEAGGNAAEAAVPADNSESDEAAEPAADSVETVTESAEQPEAEELQPDSEDAAEPVKDAAEPGVKEQHSEEPAGRKGRRRRKDRHAAEEAAAAESEHIGEEHASGELNAKTINAELEDSAAEPSEASETAEENTAAAAAESGETEAAEAISEPETVPEIEEPVSEPEPEAAEEVKPAEPSAEVLAKEAGFEACLTNMCKIKGNVRAMVLSEDFRVASSYGTFEEMELVMSALKVFLSCHNGDSGRVLDSWVCESKKGYLILMRLSNGYYLFADGRAVTLGVLRQRAERCKNELCALC